MSTLKVLQDLNNRWQEQFPNTGSTPWSSCNELIKNREGLYFLNPNNQQHLESGWMTEQDLKDWANGIPGKIITSQEHWDELLYICKTGTDCIGWDIEHFNMYPPEYLLAPGQVYHPIGGERQVGIGLPQRKQCPKRGWVVQKMSPELIMAVEKHVKYVFLRSLEDDMTFHDKTIFNAGIASEARDEVYGFMFCLCQLGLETLPGVSNTPAERENFSWWKSLLEKEAKWELLIKNSLAYEPWVKNKKSLYSGL